MVPSSLSSTSVPSIFPMKVFLEVPMRIGNPSFLSCPIWAISSQL